MKQLVLIRHGDSHLVVPPNSDFERTLTSKGEKEVTHLAKLLNDHSITPEKIITSTAVRAKSTAKLLAQKLGNQSVSEDESLYQSTPDGFLGTILGLEDSLERVLFVGHNPTISQLITELLHKEPIALSTAGACCMNFHVDSWQAIGTEMPEVVLVV